MPPIPLRPALFLAAAILLLIAPPPRTVAQDLHPFVLPWNDDRPGPTDLRTVDHPQNGLTPITVGADGHFYAGQPSSRLRLVGVNLCFGANFPTHQDAEKIAGRLAKFGVNCVRFHHMDTDPYPNGIRDPHFRDTRHLDPEALDRLDYFIAQLHKQGIYADLNLLVGRPFNAADGFPPEIEKIPWKDRHAIGFFNPHELQLQQEYARDLLTHVNPYNGHSHAQDPGLALVEINNENGLLQSWLTGALDDLPPVFIRKLQAQWNQWLHDKYHDQITLKPAWDLRIEPLGKQLLANGDFTQGAKDWNLEQHEGATAEVSIVSAPVATHPAAAQPGADPSTQPRPPSPALKITVSAPGKAGWHVQVNQTGLSLKKGQLYTATFRARAEPPACIIADAMQTHEPWSPLGLEATLDLTPRWQDFSIAFLATDDDDHARFGFTNLAAQKGAYWFSNIALRPGGVFGLHGDESLDDRSIPCPLLHGPRLWTEPAMHDWLTFLRNTEAAYWAAMRIYLKNDLHVRAPIVGTIVGTSLPSLMAQFDATDSHAYWHHPNFPHQPWDQADWTVENESMVNHPAAELGAIAWQRVDGLPHIVTEYNHPAPNTHASEAPLFLAAMAGYQDWDGIFLFDYSSRANDWDARRIMGFFDIDQHPTQMANLAAAAAMFRGGDIKPAGGWGDIKLSTVQELNSIDPHNGWTILSPSALGVRPEWSLLAEVGLSSVGTPTRWLTPNPDDADILTKTQNLTRFVSDTREMTWDVSRPGKGVFTIDAPRSKIFIGFPDGRSFNLGGVVFTPGTPGPTRQGWCTLALTVLAGDAFGHPGRALLVATGDTQNTGMKWKDATHNSVGRDWGHAPSLIEAVPATIELPIPAARLKVFALDERGQRGPELKATPKGDHTLITIGPPAITLWYEITWN